MAYPSDMILMAEPFVLTRLQADHSLLPIDTIVRELSAIADAVYAGQPSLPVWGSLSDSDKSAFAEGIGLTAAARLNGSVTTGPGGSGVVQVKTEAETTVFASRLPGEAQEWLREAVQAFRRMTYFRAEGRAAASTFAMTGLGGPSRRRMTTGRVSLLDLLTGLTLPYYGESSPIPAAYY
jgi:hypothetical protein